ncbi:MAG: hypothetical protein RLZZ511_2777 [Cyanobacteriota bacterium]|jgi:type I restriction enzyme S subunit
MVNRSNQISILRTLNTPWKIDLPDFWDVKKLKFISPQQTVGVVANPASYVEEDGEIPFLFGSCITEGRIDSNKANCISKESNQKLSKSILRTGDLVSVRVGEPGVTAVVPPELDGINCASVMIVRKHPSFDSHWLCYVMNSSVGKANLAVVVYGAAQKQFNIGHAVDFAYPVPPLIQQTKIAQFLDRKTAAIDTLIAKKQRLIELLEEKRSALINQAVTKGLDRDVRMKDSGIPWIGEIPEHWEVCELRRAWTVIDCKHKTPEYLDDGYPLVSTTEVKPGKIDLSIITRFISEDDFHDMTENRLPCKGDIIYSRNASLGSAAYVDTDQRFAMGQDVVLITSEKQDQLFLSYFLNAQTGISQVDLACVGATFRRINVGQIKQILVTVPPLAEQIAIGEYLEKIHGFYSKNVSLINLQIAKLQEYRQSLITAAVTGKLPIPDQARE